MLIPADKAWHWDPPPPSAKARIDAAIAQKLVQAAKQHIQAQDVELKQLRKPAPKSNKPKTFRPVHPSFALEIEYRRKLECLIDQMQKSVAYWVKVAFKANEPEITVLAQDSMADGVVGVDVEHEPGLAANQRVPGWGSISPHVLPLDIHHAYDALPATELRKAVRKLSRRWQRDFNTASWELGNWFGRKSYQRSTRTLHQILKKGGWTVDLKLSAAQRDILHASINENVSLIKSIPQQYFTQVEGTVMRSVTTGRDLHQLTTDLQRNFRVTRRRAELIARDQNNKVNSSLQRARQIELGVEQAVWVHSGAGKHPRPTHVRNNGKMFDVVEGWYDPAERKFIHPGQLINCRCVSRSVVPGFS